MESTEKPSAGAGTAGRGLVRRLGERVIGRRGVLGLIGAGSVSAGLGVGIERSLAGSTPKLFPPPSFTTTRGAPRVVAAHAGVLAPSSPDPQPAQQRLQVVVHASEPCAVKVQAVPGDGGDAYESVWVPTRTGLDPTNPANVAKVPMPIGCGAPGTTWTWKVLLAPSGTAVTDAADAAVHVDPVARSLPVRPGPGVPSTFRVATGSCSQVAHAAQKHRRVLSAATMATAGLTEFVHMGDTSYVDTWKEIDESTSARRYTKFAWGARMHASAPDFAALYAKVPMRVVLDDHEAGPGNCYGLNVYPEARQVLEDSFAGTSFEAAGFDYDTPPSVSYDHWSIGEADFFLLDNRIWRDGGSRKTGLYRGQSYVTQMGSTQQKWLIRGLRASKAPIKIIYAPRSFRHFYARQEQNQLLDVITGKDGGPAVSGLVIFATGDMHAAGISKLDGRAPVYEVQCSPLLNSTLHTLKPLLDWQLARGYELIWLNTLDGRPGQAVCNAWGEFEIDTRDPANRSVTVRLHRDTGEVLKELRLPVPAGSGSPTPTTSSPRPTTSSPDPTPSDSPTSATTSATPSAGGQSTTEMPTSTTSPLPETSPTPEASSPAPDPSTTGPVPSAT